MSKSDAESLSSDEEALLSSINWDVIQERVAATLNTKSTCWGATKSGGFNLIRFLQVEGHADVVVRVPLNHVENPETAVREVVATMQYFRERSTIPLPSIVCYSTSAEDAGRPFVVITRAEGTSLFHFWEDMSDNRRDVIMRQVAQILIEMYSHRFDKIGLLSRERDCGAFVIQPSQASIQNHSGRVYSSGTDYWIDYANRRLATLLEEATDYDSIYEYAHVWWMRSLVPSIYNNSLDLDGFPLMHGDFHSQNIFIVDAESDNPRVSSIIDWDNTRTISTSTFAQPPFFLVDHPLADPDDENTERISKRNARDREVFKRLLQEEERLRFPNSPQKLSQAHENWEGSYLFEQCIDGGVMYSALWDTLVRHVVGDEEAHSVWISELIEKGILKGVAEQMKQEENADRNSDVDE